MMNAVCGFSKKISGTVLLVALLSCKLSAQPQKPFQFLLSPGVYYQNEVMGELNITFAIVKITHTNRMVLGPRVGSEFNFNSKNLILAPKAGIELSFLPVCVRATIVDYIYQSRHDLRLVPEAGLSFFGFVNLTYGYNYPIGTDPGQSVIPRNKIGLSFNIYKEFFEMISRAGI